MIAGMAVSKQVKNEQIPRTRLAVARPVCWPAAWAAAMVAGLIGDGALADRAANSALSSGTSAAVFHCPVAVSWIRVWAVSRPSPAHCFNWSRLTGPDSLPSTPTILYIVGLSGLRLPVCSAQGAEKIKSRVRKPALPVSEWNFARNLLLYPVRGKSRRTLMAANKQLAKLAVALLAIFSSDRLPAATVGTFMNPVIADGADPWVIFADTNYFYTQTTGGQVTIRKSPTLTGLGFASPVTVFTPSAPNNKDVWAPELHFLRGKWYIYFAADNGNNANHRLYVAEANTSDPQGAYTSKGKIYDPANDRWAIDGTVLEKDDGSLYLIWSGWPGTSNTRQNIYIAPMSDPWTISGPRVLLSTPALDWEVYPDSSLPLINEG